MARHEVPATVIVIDDYSTAWLSRKNGVGVSPAASDESVAGEGLSKEQLLDAASALTPAPLRNKIRTENMI